VSRRGGIQPGELWWPATDSSRMEFETFAVMAVGTAFLSVTAATSAYLASPSNWPVSVGLGVAAMVLFVAVAVRARNRGLVE
jgi:hypothetical protein